MKLNDEILSKALLDAAEAEYEHILSEDTPVRFSQKYMKRRRRFLRDPFNYTAGSTHTWIKPVVQAAVVVLVFASLLLSARFTGSAQASEIQMMSKLYKDQLTYSVSQNYTPTADTGIWYPQYLPEGFKEYKTEDNGDFRSIHYVNGTKLIDFVCFHTSAYMNITMHGGSYVMEPCEVNGEPAIFHQGKSSGISNVLMWFSQDGDLVFLLEARLPLEEMVKIADSVTLK